MSFLKCKQCDHVDTLAQFLLRNRQTARNRTCPRCANDQGNFIDMGDEVSCSDCIYHAWGARSCTHPDNRSGSDFWNRPQETCYTSRHCYATQRPQWHQANEAVSTTS